MFLRSATRAAARSSAMPTTALRSYRTVSGPMACLNARPQAEKKSIAPQQTRAASEHAISNPTLAGIEKRWEAMPPQEQADLWMQLRDRMKVDWHQMTLQEKKAGMLRSLALSRSSPLNQNFADEVFSPLRSAYWISFGPHGPRTLPPKGENLKIFVKVVQLTLVSFGIFYVIHLFAKPQPKTMTKEWQEASNEYALVRKLSICINCWPIRSLLPCVKSSRYLRVCRNSKRRSTLSTVSAPRVTRARASSRAPLLRSNRLLQFLGRDRYDDWVCRGWAVLGYRNELLPAIAQPLMTPVLCPSSLDTILRLCSTCLSMLAPKDLCISYCAIINYLLCSHRSDCRLVNVRLMERERERDQML